MTNYPRYAKRYDLDRARGVRRYVPAGPVYDRVKELTDAGYSCGAIATAVGLGHSSICALAAGQRKYVQRFTAAKILALTVASLEARERLVGRVPRVGTIRRIQALLALGHRHADISAVMRSHGARIGSGVVLHEIGDLVEMRTHKAVAAAYEELSMRIGPSEVTRARARALGYMPPLAYDDEHLDDPEAEPHVAGPETPALDDLLVELYMEGHAPPVPTGRRAPVERREAIRRLAGKGWDDGRIGRRVGMARDAVLKERTRHGIPAGTPREAVA